MAGPVHGRIPSVRRIPVPVTAAVPHGSTNAYVVRTVRNGTRHTLLVDPAARTPAVDAAIVGSSGDELVSDDFDQPGVPSRSTSDDRLSDEVTGGIDAIVVTHSHGDHVGGVAEYASGTEVRTYAHEEHVDRFVSATAVEPDDTFRDGDPIGETGVVALDTPGHAPDHVAFEVPRSGSDGDPGTGFEDGSARSIRRDLIVGDLAVASGSVAVTAPDGSMTDYVESLRRIRGIGAERLYPGHGPVIEEPMATCDRLIAHRLRREERVFAAISDGANDISAIVDAAYDKDLSGVEALAAATVRAHVETLIEDDRIAPDMVRT